MDLTSGLKIFQRREFVLSPEKYAAFRSAVRWSGSPRCTASSSDTLSRLQAARAPYTKVLPERQTTWSCVAAR
jgi:hypothetical protein